MTDREYFLLHIVCIYIVLLIIVMPVDKPYWVDDTLHVYHAKLYVFFLPFSVNTEYVCGLRMCVGS